MTRVTIVGPKAESGVRLSPKRRGHSNSMDDSATYTVSDVIVVHRCARSPSPKRETITSNHQILPLIPRPYYRFPTKINLTDESADNKNSRPSEIPLFSNFFRRPIFARSRLDDLGSFIFFAYPRDGMTIIRMFRI